MCMRFKDQIPDTDDNGDKEDVIHRIQKLKLTLKLISCLPVYLSATSKTATWSAMEIVQKYEKPEKNNSQFNFELFTSNQTDG